MRHLQNCSGGLSRLLEQEGTQIHVSFKPLCVEAVDRERYRDLSAGNARGFATN